MATRCSRLRGGEGEMRNPEIICRDVRFLGGEEQTAK
jgi:hypothetical protein